MTDRRRGIRLHRFPWETAMWFATSRLAITLAAVVAVVILAAVLALARPWQALTEERAVCAPAPIVAIDGPGSERLVPGDGGGETPRFTSAPVWEGR